MFQESAGKIFLRYAIPQMVGLLFNSIYVIVDGVFIGARLGSSALAAAGAAVPAVELLVALSMAVTSGAGVLISVRLAASDRKKALQAFNTCMLLQAVISFVIALTGNLFIHPLARMLGATPEIHDMTVTYLRYILIFSPFLLFSYLMGGLARNDGKPGLAMAALSLGSLSNIVLDYVFMYPFNMGIAGAALATAVGPLFSILILLPHFLRRNGRLYFARVRLSLSDAGRFLTLGFPSFVMEFSIGMVTFFMNSGINRYGYGEEGLAAYLIIGYLMLIILTIFLGMAEGLQPAFSYLYASGDTAKLQSLRRCGICAFSAFGLAAYALVLLLALPFYTIFTPGAESLAQFAAEQSRLYFSGFLCAGLNILMISFFQATAATGRALLLSALRGCLLPGLLVFTLPAIFGPQSLWGCHSLAEALTLLVCILISFLGRNSHVQRHAQTKPASHGK